MWNKIGNGASIYCLQVEMKIKIGWILEVTGMLTDAKFFITIL